MSLRRVFLLTLAFFVVTGIVFPWSLYPLNPESILSPESTEPISPLRLYGTAALALSPWVVLSPWPILWLARPQTGGHEGRSLLMTVTLVVGLPVLLVVYSGLFAALAYLFERRRRLSLLALLVLCGLSAGYGLPTVKEIHVDPARRLNGLLERMRAASHKRPFPEGTRMGFRSVQSWNTEAVRKGRDPVVFTVVSEDSAIDLWFLDSSRPAPLQWREEKCKAWSASREMIGLAAISNDLWRCTVSESSVDSATGRPRTRRVFWDFGFLDRERRIYAELVYSLPVERLASPDQLLSFFAYYRPPAAPHAPSR